MQNPTTQAPDASGASARLPTPQPVDAVEVLPAGQFAAHHRGGDPGSPAISGGDVEPVELCAGRREELIDEIRDAPDGTEQGMRQHLTVLDKRIVNIENDLERRANSPLRPGPGWHGDGAAPLISDRRRAAP